MIRPALALAVLAALSLAGCTTNGSDQRDDSLFIHIESGGHYTVLMPLPIDALATFDVWMSRLSVSLGNATIDQTDSAFGPAVRITGQGSTDIEAHLVYLEISRHADAFLDATWSTGSTNPPQNLRMHLEGSVASMSIKHEATSCRGAGCPDNDYARAQVCWIETRAATADVQQGWNAVHAVDTRDCTQAP